ncbi:MAG: septum formation initiator family protein [Methylomonas sp.]|nr:septum formation initiator family protein [Methylomonas sp.]PPD19969.1 MAG: cell division protein FtsB [Methylomonas sp.]PPD26528.1 MAG: cell division protein FtsB [Methylomonas sp.]PPD36933.1 MAG: cell division protein FtsB [Methylomonas sp.]PPD38295.1 MAG: cell division protein FtsB [Methylomonas sp.]
MKTLVAIIIALTLHFQYRLWFGDANIAQISEYRERLEQLNKQIQEKKDRNDALYAEVKDLRRGLETIEERARYDLGMIKENETFFQVLE